MATRKKVRVEEAGRGQLIEITGPSGVQARGILRGKIDPATLKERLRTFLEALQDVVAGAPEKFGEFKLDTISLTAEVHAKGQLSLLGTGGDLGGKGLD